MVEFLQYSSRKVHISSQMLARFFHPNVPAARPVELLARRCIYMLYSRPIRMSIRLTYELDPGRFAVERERALALFEICRVTVLVHGRLLPRRHRPGEYADGRTHRVRGHGHGFSRRGVHRVDVWPLRPDVRRRRRWWLEAGEWPLRRRQWQRRRPVVRWPGTVRLGQVDGLHYQWVPVRHVVLVHLVPSVPQRFVPAQEYHVYRTRIL